MSTQSNNNHSMQSSELSPEQMQVSTSYRLVQKKYFCHVCAKEFKKMSPTLEMVDVSCPDCEQCFCEEISNASP